MNIALCVYNADYDVLTNVIHFLLLYVYIWINKSISFFSFFFSNFLCYFLQYSCPVLLSFYFVSVPNRARDHPRKVLVRCITYTKHIAYSCIFESQRSKTTFFDIFKEGTSESPYAVNIVQVIFSFPLGSLGPLWHL